MNSLIARLSETQMKVNSILTHQQPVPSMPVPASDDDLDIYVFKTFKMAMDALEQATRWIPIDERLPDIGNQWDGRSWVVGCGLVPVPAWRRWSRPAHDNIFLEHARAAHDKVCPQLEFVNTSDGDRHDHG